MAGIQVSIKGHTNGSNKTYTSFAPFHNHLFQYITENHVGRLIPAVGATETICGAGHELYTTNRNLYPGINSGVKTFMVGVYDPITCLRGYIDPNEAVFSIRYLFQMRNTPSIVSTVVSTCTHSEQSSEHAFPFGAEIREGTASTISTISTTSDAIVDSVVAIAEPTPATEPTPVAEPVPESVPEPLSDIEPYSEPPSDTEPYSESEPEPEPQSEAEPEPQSEAEPEPHSEAEPEPEPEPHSEAEPEQEPVAEQEQNP